MADEQESKRKYTPRVPEIGAVVKAIVEGKYDNNISELDSAVRSRLDKKREDVMTLVREAFGPDAEILLRKTRIEEATDTPPMPQRFEVAQPDGSTKIVTPDRNPFLDRLRKSNPSVTEPAEKAIEDLAARHPQLDEVAAMLPGPYRRNPVDGNAYRVATDHPAPEGMLAISDVFGGHVVGVAETEYAMWEEVPASAPKTLNENLDAVEQQMNQEGDVQIQQPVDIEHRGAQIAGLGPGDMGG